MDKKKLEELIRLVEESDISELTVSGPMRSVKIVKGGARPVAHEYVPAPPATAVQAAPRQEEQESVAAEPASDRDSGLIPIASPMVGTFYAAPSPEAPPYVRQGDHVSKGQVVCIVEAMKLMNEIEAEVAGTVVRVVAENAKPVEFGQTIFLVDPD